MRKQCGNCRFFIGMSCKRYPPKIYDIQKFPAYPNVKNTDWCGEFQWNGKCTKEKWDEILG